MVEVDEAGTVAAAATAVVMTRSLPAPAVELTFDRPFLFLIQHDASAAPVFMGLVQAPKEA